MQELEIPQQTFYTRKNSPKWYQYGADELFHHIPNEPTFKSLYGAFNKHITIEVEFDDKQIGKPLKLGSFLSNIIK